MKTVETFKYLDSLVDANGRAEKDVKNNKTARSKWREITGMMCDMNMPAKLKGKEQKTSMKPGMVYGAECYIAPN